MSGAQPAARISLAATDVHAPRAGAGMLSRRTPPRRSTEHRLELGRVFDAEEEGRHAEHAGVVLQPRLKVRRALGHAHDTDPHRSLARWHPCSTGRRVVNDIRGVVQRRYKPLDRCHRTLLCMCCLRFLIRPHSLLMLL